MQTYPDLFELKHDQTGNEVAITCKLCERTSYNENDIFWRYCGNCHLFLDDIWPPARQSMLDKAKAK